MKATGNLTKTRTGNIADFEMKGYPGQYSNKAYEILSDLMDPLYPEDEDFPWGECGWFDIMTYDNKEYAVFAEDSLTTDCDAYYVKVRDYDEEILDSLYAEGTSVYLNVKDIPEGYEIDECDLSALVQTKYEEQLDFIEIENRSTPQCERYIWHKN